jgi:acyl-CoA thioesterase FadM
MNYLDPVLEFHLSLPRHAIGPRQVARAGEIWRLFQEAAVQASISAGWPPSRYRSQGTGFVVGAMTVCHHRELRSDTGIVARTWVRDFRRGMLSRRQLQILDGEGLVSDATQSWVHVGESEGELQPCRASDELIAAFPPVVDPGPAARLPPWESMDALILPEFHIEIWHGWMDPMGHANHPVYIDWCDEALARSLSVSGAEPSEVVSVAEQVRWRRAAMAGERVAVKTRAVGHSATGLVLLHELVNLDDGGIHASAVTVRRLNQDSDGSGLESCLRSGSVSPSRLR